jgi:hypothetical protein
MIPRLHNRLRSPSLHQREMVSLRWTTDGDWVMFTKAEWDAAWHEAFAEVKGAKIGRTRGNRYYWRPGHDGYKQVVYRAKEILFLRRDV